MVLASCLLLAGGALGPARTPAPPPDAGVRVAEAVARPPASPARPPAAATVAPPVSLAVPALGVEAPVDPVGVEPDGSMTIPGDGGRVGWYRFGPAPGAPSGSAVLAGHVDTRAGGPGALFRLAELQPGAELVVTSADGAAHRYRVVARETIVKQELPTERLFSRDGPPVLTVITCGGPFRPELRSYRDNVVVVAEPVAGPRG